MEVSLTLEIVGEIQFVDGSGSRHSVRCLGCGDDPKRYYRFQGRFKEVGCDDTHLMIMCNGCYPNSEAFAGLPYDSDGSSVE